MCYCETNRDEIRKHLNMDDVPDSALTNACCWNAISLTHKEYSAEVSEKIWNSIVEKRSILLLNMNPFSSDA